MASLPYVSSPGSIDKAINGIKAAQVPPRVSGDFIKSILKIPGGSGNQMTAFLKKIGLANADGTPSDVYKKLRNPTTAGAAVAAAIRHGYASLYIRNEFMHTLDDNELTGLIMEETGEARDSNTVKLSLSCIKHLKTFADFSGASEPTTPLARMDDTPTYEPSRSGGQTTSKVGFNLGYTINLNLPATADPAVFDAIFKSLKEHLLRDEDA